MQENDTGDLILKRVVDMSEGRSEVGNVQETMTLTREAQELMQKDSGLIELPNNKYSVVVSDVHARPEMLAGVLRSRNWFRGLPDQPLISHVLNGSINLVFVGDYSHSEDPTAWTPDSSRFKLLDSVSKELFNTRYKEFCERYHLADTNDTSDKFWASADGQELLKADALKARAEEYEAGMKVKGSEEVERWMKTWNILMNLKVDAPENVFFLRGNHDDQKGEVLEAEKFVMQNQYMVHWLTQNEFSQTDVDTIAATEEAMPLVARRINNEGQLDLMVSHALARRPLTDVELIRSKSKEAYRVIVTGDNRVGYMEDTVRDALIDNLSQLVAEGHSISPNFRWIIGHRAVAVGAMSRKQGNLLQINDSERYLYAIVPPDTKNFDPKRHVWDARYNQSEHSREKRFGNQK